MSYKNPRFEQASRELLSFAIYPDGGGLSNVGDLLRSLDGDLVQGRPELLVPDLEPEAEVARDAVGHGVDVEHVHRDLELDAVVVVRHAWLEKLRGKQWP